MNINPSETIVPLLALDDNYKIQQFLGTASFVWEHSWLVTAEHVIRDWNGLFGVTRVEDLNHIYLANLLNSDPNSDLALLEVSGYAPKKPLQLADVSEILQNKLVVCYEYGTTQVEGKYLRFSPATRIGNVTRRLNWTDRSNKAGDDILELSFPALRGASGSPVLSNDNLKLWGIVIANASYHLLPAQIESVLDEKNSIIEETHYLLPQALAVNVKHIQTIIERQIAISSQSQ